MKKQGRIPHDVVKMIRQARKHKTTKNVAINAVRRNVGKELKIACERAVNAMKNFIEAMSKFKPITIKL